MSDIKEKLNSLLRKPSKPAGIGSPADRGEGLESSPMPETPGSSDKQKTLDRLRALITQAQTQIRTRKPASIEQSIPKGLLVDSFEEGPGQNIEDLIAGEYVETPYGPCFRVRTEYPWQYYQGKVPVCSLLEGDLSQLKWILKDVRLHNPDIYRTIFFDTETTGLDTGTGIYIFLAGFGYFQDRRFIVEQYFMRDFPEEPAVIHALSELLSRFDNVVSYNGKTYDWPLLETRFVVNRKSLPRRDPAHLDLLHVARRLYKHRMENCKLTTVEREILGFYRVDDLPGAMMPDLYFKYVRSRDARFIHKAFSHNAHDIISMAAFLSEIIRFFSDPYITTPPFPVSDIAALGRLMDELDERESAETAYRWALGHGVVRELYADTLRRLSLILKNQDRWNEALELWELMITTIPDSDAFPFIETAKYLEHRSKDYREARQIVHSCMEHMRDQGWQSHQTRMEIEHRLNRLDLKIQKMDQGIDPSESAESTD